MDSNLNDQINGMVSRDTTNEHFENCDYHKELTDNDHNTSIESIEQPFERTYISQNIIGLSSPPSQPLPQTRKTNNCYEKLFTNDDDLDCDFSTQKLFSLCARVVDTDITDNNNNNSDGEDIGNSMRERKKFNVESDSENSDNELNNDSDSNSCDDLNDNEENCVENEDKGTDDEEDDALSENILNVKEFIEDEAELSGSDASSDEEEDYADGDDELEDELQEDVPSDSELRAQIGRIHHKQLLDEDKREVLLMQERYIENGDLHDDGKTRTKMYNWKGMQTVESVWQNVYLDSDSGSDDNELEIKQPNLKMDESETETVDHSSNSINNTDYRINLKQQFSIKSTNSLSNFVVRDERLKTIISKRPLNCKNQSNKMNKKFRNNKKTNYTSIFDVLTQF